MEKLLLLIESGYMPREDGVRVNGVENQRAESQGPVPRQIFGHLPEKRRGCAREDHGQKAKSINITTRNRCDGPCQVMIERTARVPNALLEFGYPFLCNCQRCLN